MAAKKGKRIFQSLLILIAAGLCLAPGLKAVNQPDLKIATTIFPLADIAQHIASSKPMGFRSGGGEAKVVTILPAGADPHTFELTPQAVKELEDARIIFMIGHGLDDWVRAIGESLPKAKMFTVDSGIDLGKFGAEDPHYWLSIANAKIIANNIAHALAELEPGKKDQFQSNLDRYIRQLDETDRSIRKMLSNLSARKIITFHDGWRYFARDYGLEVVGNVESSQGSEPTPKRLTHLADVVREQKIKVLFSEPAVSKMEAESLAQDLHLRLYELDSMGGSGNRRSFLALMLANAHTIREALSYG